METKRVATQNARKNRALLQFFRTAGTMLLFSIILSLIACDTSDDLRSMERQSPIPNESPQDSESPPDGVSNIIYFDINPDFISTNLGDSFNLDLNNDQIVDFTLSSSNNDSGDWFFIASNPLMKNSIISAAPWYSNPVPLNLGMEIFNLRGYKDGEFYETTSFFYFGSCPGGDSICPYDWKNKNNRYLGLKFIIKGEIYYGWVRIDSFSPSQWVIKDYAYNATPEKPILAGQTK